MLIGSTILNRLFFHSSLPPLLLPALAIELAPPAVAGIAYFALTGGRTDLAAHVLAGYAVLMVIVQVRMLPRFTRLKFAPGLRAFTFSWAATASSWAAAASYALEWITLRRPPGAAAYAVAILAAITAVIGCIAARTAVLAARGQLLPPRATPEKVNAVIAQNGGGDPVVRLARSRD